MIRAAAVLVLGTLALGVFALSACTELVETVRPPLPPHDAYAASLAQAGLDSTALGRRWNEAAMSALAPDGVADLPLTVRPDFEASEPGAWSRRFDLRQGEILRIEIAPPDGDSALVFVDLFAATDSTVRGRHTDAVVQGDTLRIEHRATSDAPVLLRLQPELLVDIELGVSIETAPSLAFPVQGEDEGAIRSRWGASRDGGTRSHEGVDIFAERGTPALAAGPGRVTRVQETPIGGRVVWLRPDGEGVSLYYAHLDSQAVARGQRVAAGDTLGFVGNTGNARTTPPHLHFGVYGRGGAVNPEPFLVGRRPGPRTVRMP